ncbi:hypothetical protein [Leptospira interrogans]|uniref:hypothetical protein n=1 Tax=Leptospira interrogans TaxID=173 RepID=UPI001F2EA0B1|nr:hypothetical protein [Leptospira interrogans]
MNWGLLEVTYFHFGWDKSDEIDNHPFLPIPTAGPNGPRGSEPKDDLPTPLT